jgi:tight adherence protein B
MYVEGSLFFFLIMAICFAFCVTLYIYFKMRHAQNRLQYKLSLYKPRELVSKIDKDTPLFIKQNRSQVEPKLGEFFSKKIILPRVVRIFIKNSSLHYLYVISFFCLGWILVTSLISFITKLNLLFSVLAGGGVCVVLFYYILDYIDRQQGRRFLKIFPHALDIIARGLKAGITIEKTFSTIVREIEEPVKEEFKYILDQINFGVPFEKALRNAANRIPHSGFHFFVSVLILQKKTGGSAADLVEAIAYVLRAQEELRRKINALSAEAKTTGWIVGSLPILAFIAISFMRPEYIEVLQNDSLGYKLLLLAIGLLIASAITIKRMVNFREF